MENTYSRRKMLGATSALIPMKVLGSRLSFLSLDATDGNRDLVLVADTYPNQSPELVRELVTVSHFDLKRVRELVDAQPSLARATQDWGFGDWEDALGAASHTGNRAIAEYLISKGARPTLFSATMLGHLDAVKAHLASQPGVERIRGPHGITLLAHAKAGAAQASDVFEYLKSLRDADKEPEAPLPDEQRTRLLGTYGFDVSPNQRIDVTLEGNGPIKTLTWTRRGKLGRPIYHLGSNVFYPAGAPDVRIRFADDNGSMMMTITDPGVVLTAKRI
jgi:hypothetical protein